MEILPLLRTAHSIAWTYLLHVYCRGKKIEYRYYDQKAKKKVLHETKIIRTMKLPDLNFVIGSLKTRIAESAASRDYATSSALIEPTFRTPFFATSAPIAQLELRE